MEEWQAESPASLTGQEAGQAQPAAESMEDALHPDIGFPVGRPAGEAGAPAGKMARLLRIAIVTPGSFEVRSARKSSVEQVVGHLTRILQQAADFRIIGRKRAGFAARERRDGVDYVRLSCRHRSYARVVAESLRRWKPDVIQVENRPRLARALKRSFPGVPVVLSLHSVMFMSPPHIRKQSLRNCLGQVDHIMTNSRFLQQKVAEQSPVLWNQSKVHVNHLGVDTTVFRPVWEEEQLRLREQLRSAFEFTDKRVILYVGRLLPMKGVHHILEAMPRIAAEVPEAVLVIVGSAYYGSRRMTRYVRRLRLLAQKTPGKVHFIPFVPHEQIPEWFCLADVLAVPSFGKEAFGLVNVEAMATGLPVVATRSGGMTEIIEDRITGRLIDPIEPQRELGPALVELLRNASLCRTYGEAGRSRVEQRFTWEAYGRRWLDFYQIITAGGQA
ncbi:glycosyltransferase family 4 protein [Paenibacillus sp. y28]|uniref:glycosyltransferase family 4 protein n=1 Tax=Paenibacillus sp. y28 TaxID=3129110 RepID=UPI003015CA78